MSFHEYLNNLRLEKAAEKLRMNSAAITDVAMTCGFNNVTYFNRLFRKKYGMSPGQYKKLH
jgi:AraC-like DNA-binding protein